MQTFCFFLSFAFFFVGISFFFCITHIMYLLREAKKGKVAKQKLHKRLLE